MNKYQGPEQRAEPPERITRIIEFKLRLEWVLGICGVVGWALISMYFSLNTLVKTVADLQIDVKAGNNSVTAIASELALVKYRLATTEARIQSVEDNIKKGIK